MSRTSTTLRRLGVPSLAAVTMVAGVPAFLGSAQAAHITGLNLTPETASAAAGVCQPFTVQLSFATAAQAKAETVDVVITEGGVTPSATQDVDFCTASTNGVTPASPQDSSDTGAAGSSDRAEFTTDATGKVTFGVVTSDPGTVNIRAFYETTDNDTFDAGEFTDTSVFTAGQGGPAGSNANQDAASTVEVVSSTQAATATADSDTDIAVEGEARTYRVAVLNAAGQPLAGVTVSREISSTDTGANQGPATFGVTNNDGIATGTVTFPTRATAGNTTDTVTFYVNQTDGTTAGNDALEPDDTVVVTVRENTGQTNRTVTVTPLADTEAGTNPNYQTSPAVNPATDGDRTFRAVVDAADGQPSTTGTLLSFAVTGGSGDETVAPVEGSTSDNVGTADSNDSFTDVVVNDPTPTPGQSLTVTATVRGTSATGSSTLTFRNQPGDARFVELTPESTTTAPNTAKQFTATVKDVDGGTVEGVQVTFTETGAGAFRNGSSSVTATTNAQGRAFVETISLPGETGTQTITATISGAATQCDEPANSGTDPQGNALNSTTNTGAAGDCDDTATNVFTTETASPTPTSPAPTTPAPGNPGSATGTVKLQGSVEDDTIVPTEKGVVTITGTPNANIELFAYSRPSTDYRLVRQGSLGADGRIQFDILPGTNTRLFASYAGSEPNTLDSESFVQNVATALSLSVVRNGSLDYTFQGRILPRRAGQLITLYRVDDERGEVITSQVRTDDTGTWRIRRVFTGQGVFPFIARTGQNLTNVAGESNVRPTAIYAGPQR